MKKRIACMLLSLLMVISLIPFGALNASAASYLTHSESIVNLIKQFEGFSTVAFWDVSQWSVGYGTTGYQGQTMTEAQADEALRSALTRIDTKINEFASRYGKYFTQAQHDALVSFSFNCGTEWMDTNGRFRTAIINNATGNELLYAFSLWANINSVPDRGLISRRLAEANLYLNGQYSKNPPSNFTYVVLDANGGTPGSNGEDKMQGYYSNMSTRILAANPTRAGYVFGGWFDAATGGKYVDLLDGTTAGKTLYAQWGVQVAITTSFANIRNGAGTNYPIMSTRNGGETLVIVQTANVGNSLWGRCAAGWIALENTNYASVAGSMNLNGQTAAQTGTVVCNSYINVRGGAGTNYPVVGSITNGSKVNIYEIAPAGGVNWARIDNGRWISMAYVQTDSSSNVIWGGGTPGSQNSGNNTNPQYSAGYVTTNGVNVRKAAGIGNQVVAILNANTQVKVYEQTDVGGVKWGRIDQGWICMAYVQLTAAPVNPDNNNNNNNNNPGTVVGTGTVSTNTNLIVRSGAGTNYPSLRYLSNGTRVSIVEKVTVGNAQWGRLSDGGWVCLTYVKLDNTNPAQPDPAGQTGVVVGGVTLNVRSGAGTEYPKVGSLSAGTRVTILEKVTAAGMTWGRIGANQWISLAYVTMDNNGGTPAGPGTGKVTTGLNVRSAAGTGNAIVGAYAAGASVTIYEVTTVAGVQWGRTDKGWVCMRYIQMTSSGSGNGSNENVSWH